MWEFIKEYIKHPSTVGAIAPSGTRLAEKMVEGICFDSCKTIVEYGAGTGVFTEEVIKRKQPETLFIVFEKNRKFYEGLYNKYSAFPNVFILCESAADIDIVLKKHDVETVDYIISGLPFTSLPFDVTDTILNKTKIALGQQGKFITFQYSKAKFKLFRNYLSIKRVTWEPKNLPPAYVVEMSNG